MRKGLIMPITSLLIGGALALSACGGDAEPAAVGGEGRSVEERARDEGRLSVTGSVLPEPVVEELTKRMQEEYGVDMELQATTAPESMERLRAEQLAGDVTIDVLLIGGQYGLVAEEDGFLEPADYPTEGWQFPKSQTDSWLTYGAPPYGLLVNREVVGQDWPESWEDLANAPFSELFLFDDPTRGSVGFTWSVAAKEGHLTEGAGDEYLMELGSQPNFTFQGNPTDGWARVARGEAGVHMPISVNDAMSVVDSNPNVEFVNPGGTAYVVASNVGRVADAPHPNAAQLFIDLLVSPEIQQMLAEHNVVPGDEEVAAKGKYDFAMEEAILPESELYLSHQDQVQSSQQWYGR